MNLRYDLDRTRGDIKFDQVIQQIPYARLTGMSCIPIGESILFILPPEQNNIGNPSLPALHGGVIAGFKEMSASLLLTQNARTAPKVVDFAIDYLRPGRLQEGYAECQVIRHGKKLSMCRLLRNKTARKPQLPPPVQTCYCSSNRRQQLARTLLPGYSIASTSSTRRLMPLAASATLPASI